MQAIVLSRPGGLDRLQLVEREPVAPGPGEIQVQVQASSLNFHDYAIVTGMLPVDDQRIPLSDGAGVVTAVGEGVTGFAVGDAVLSCFFPNWQDGGPDEMRLRGVPGDHADGFAAELVTMPATAFTRLPAGYSPEQAATLTCAGLTAWRALMVEARVKPGDTVLVQGSGGVSVFALQFARAAGCRVIATSSSDEKLARLQQLGASDLINYRENENWGEEARRLTGGRGVDVIIEVGGPGTVGQSVRAVAVGGHISMIGVLTGMSGDFPTAGLMQKNAIFHGITVGSRQHQLDMIEAVESNGIEPVIDSSWPLSELADAFRHQESQRHFGKICITL